MSLAVRPASYAEACAFVDRIHRHHRAPAGHKFSLKLLNDDGLVVGVAMVGRPVARAFDDGLTLEVTRVAVLEGAPNACSALYGAAWRSGKAQGYQREITYTQDGESGSSLRAAGWLEVARRRARGGWDTPSRRRSDRGTDGVVRTLWQVSANGAPQLPDLSDEIRDETGWGLHCMACLEPMDAPPVGRIPRYCSHACRQWAYRRRIPAGN